MRDLSLPPQGHGELVDRGASSYIATDGVLADAASPTDCAQHKQGDGDVALHDLTLEETLSGVVMMADSLLVARDAGAIRAALPLLARTADLLEARRDWTCGATTAGADAFCHLFLSGPESNLLAPSFGGWRLPNGKFSRAYAAGVAVMYTAALDRLVELELLANRT